MTLLPPNLAHFQKDLEELLREFSPFSKRIYIVGGAVRDLHLDIKPKELDIEIYDIDVKEFENLATNIGAVGVGKSFFVYKWRNFDLSLPRTESKVANSHQGFEVFLADHEKEASFRRDFTINALMLNVFSAEILDFWGGKEDIKNRTIRYIDKEKFSEDSLRVLRGIQFASRFGFIVESKTLHVMEKIDLTNLSKTRIFWELEKFFNAQFIEIGVLLGYKIKLWDKLFGTNICFEDIFFIANKIRKMKKFAPPHLRPYIFLYVFVNELKLHMKNILEIIQAPKEYYNMLLYSPYITLPIDEAKLLELAIERALKHWVGICQKGLVKQAQKLGVYEEKFSGGILAQNVIKDGFRGAEIKSEIRRRKLEKISQLTCKKTF